MPNSNYDDRLDHLLEVAASVFAAKGYHSTTMRDLARESGMSLSGMYYYVAGKDELLRVIQERCFRLVIEGAEAAILGIGDPRDRLTRFVAHHVEFFSRHMSEMKVLSHEAESLAGSGLETVQKLKRHYVEMLVGIIKGLGGDVEVDPRIAAYALFGTMNWIYTWYDPQGHVAPAELAQQFATIFLNGITQHAAVAVAQGG